LLEKEKTLLVTPPIQQTFPEKQANIQALTKLVFLAFYFLGYPMLCDVFVRE
jgi:hypothetical protein